MINVGNQEVERADELAKQIQYKDDEIFLHKIEDFQFSKRNIEVTQKNLKKNRSSDTSPPSLSKKRPSPKQ
jgi:hypothetical protein